ncbi:hypothetical protein HMPREF1495_0086 [Lachnoanaerobaculum sp. MSX33]|nr:hypothetical protein HMPREF1495_0086 [Lachnoanaerobaculum sp. MSX33]
MLTELDYINAAEYYMQKKYGEKFEGEYVYEDSVYVHPKSKPEWHVVVDFESEGGMTSFHDNYVGYLKKEELEKYIYELVKPIYGECKVYIHPYGFALDDSWNKGIDMRTYESVGMYNAYIFTSKQAESVDEDFKRTCENFINKDLNVGDLSVTYIKKEELDKFEERLISYTFNRLKFYCRISSVYSNVDKIGFGDVDILEGDKNYGKQ